MQPGLPFACVVVHFLFLVGKVQPRKGAGNSAAQLDRHGKKPKHADKELTQTNLVPDIGLHASPFRSGQPSHLLRFVARLDVSQISPFSWIGASSDTKL